MVHKEIHAVRDVLEMYKQGAKGRSTFCAIAQGKQKAKRIHKFLFWTKKIVLILAAIGILVCLIV